MSDIDIAMNGPLTTCPAAKPLTLLNLRGFLLKVFFSPYLMVSGDECISSFLYGMKFIFFYKYGHRQQCHKGIGFGGTEGRDNCHIILRGARSLGWEDWEIILCLRLKDGEKDREKEVDGISTTVRGLVWWKWLPEKKIIKKLNRQIITTIFRCEKSESECSWPNSSSETMTVLLFTVLLYIYICH